MVKAAGIPAVFFLNVGPLPNGVIQKKFTDTLKQIRNWMEQYGKTIFGSRGNIIDPQG